MNLSPLPIQKFFDNNGNPLVGGLLFTYASGTSTKIATSRDQAGTTNTNPVVLDYRGEASVWLDQTLTYKFVLAPAGDTDPPTKPIWTVDNISAGITFASLTAQIIGQILYPRTAAEIAAGVTPSAYQYGAYDVRRYGAIECSKSNAAQQVLNKAAIQTAISVLNADVNGGGGMVLVPSGCQWGYKYNDTSTQPSFVGITVPIVIEDYSLGDTFAGYPTIYDGAQVRYIYYTPPTFGPLTFTAGLASGATSGTLSSNWTGLTGPQNVFFSNGNVRNVTLTNGATTATWTTGLTSTATASAQVWTFFHNGNTQYIRSDWNPGLFIMNDSVLAAAGAASRTTFDNRRCQVSFGWGTTTAGNEAWKIGQGTQQGTSFTDEELANFALQKVAVPGDTLGSYAPYLVERKTGNQSFGIATNLPRASYDFYAPSAGFYMALFENSWATDSSVLLRSSTGIADDAGISQTSGRLALFFRATGEALFIDKTSRRIGIASSIALTSTAVSYSASITYNASDSNFFTITATNATPFTINAPTNAVTNLFHTLTIRNASGGALGAATFNAVFKLAAWTQPANGFSRSITFRFDNTNWVEYSRTPADVPN